MTVDASASEAPWAVGVLYAWDVDDDGDWEFDEGCCHTGSLAHEAVDLSFDEPGVHPVRLHYTDHEGRTDTERAHVAVTVDGDDRAPTASFYVADPDPRFGAPFELRATSRDADGSIVAHRWDLDGDGAYDDATGTNLSVEYVDGDDDGAAEELDGAAEIDFDDDLEEHDVSVMAVDDGGRYATATHTVELMDGEDRATDDDDNLYAPTAEITIQDGGDGVQVGETVALDCRNSSDMAGLVIHQTWDVDGDGAYEYDKNATNDATLEHRRVNVSFDEPGVHPVTLKVTDDQGAVDRVRRAIRVDPPETHDVAAPAMREHSDGAAGDDVQLVADVPTATDIAEYEWDTDGDDVTDELGPTAVAANGTAVTLKIETPRGAIATNGTTIDGA